MTENAETGKTKERQVKSQYNRAAGDYDRRWKSYVASTLHFLDRWLELKGNENILDAACGTGELEKLLTARQPDLKITGIDFSEKMLAVARKKLSGRRHVCFKTAPASELPFPKDHFDLIVCASAFHYFDHPEKSLSEMHRVLKPDGKVVILDWCRDYILCRLFDFALKIFDPAHQQCYGRQELQGFLNRARFRILAQQSFRIRFAWGMMIAEAAKAGPEGAPLPPLGRLFAR